MSKLTKLVAAGLVAVGVGGGLYSVTLEEQSRVAPNQFEGASKRFNGFEVGELKPIAIDVDLSELDLERTFAALDDQEAKIEGRATSPLKTTLRTMDQRRDQVRDLMFRAVVFSFDGDPATAVKAVHDTNPFRKNYLDTTTTSQYGLVRHAVLENGITAVMLPADMTLDQRRDALAKVTDAVVVQTGDRAKTVVIFEYCFDDPENALNVPPDVDLLLQEDLGTYLPYFATLMLSEVLDGTDLFTAEYGYVERTVTSLAELEGFLDATDDLIKVGRSTGESRGAVLAGRDYASRSYGKITTEHISTLFHAYRQIEAAQQRYSRSLNGLAQSLVRQAVSTRLGAGAGADMPEVLAEALRYYAAGWDEIIDPALRSVVNQVTDDVQASIFSELEELSKIYGTCQWEFAGYNIWKETGPESAQLKTMYNGFRKVREDLPLREQSLLRGAAGFSLDSAYDTTIFQKTYADFMETDQTGVAKVLEPFDTYIRQQLRLGNEKFLLCAMQDFEDANANEIFKQVSKVLQDPARYQTARYDGGLHGTEVGQILFITDLLAKLLDWDFNNVFNRYFPNGAGDWTPSVYVNPPVHYGEQLEKLPGTRIWFGLRSGAQIEVDNAMHFQSVATRVFALSHSNTAEERELQPNFLAEGFVNWFNNHYDNVAAVEARYDQLNQIMKWSIALDDAFGYSGAPRFFGEASIRRDLWFPDWAVEHGEANAEAWASCFHDRGRYAHDVETMPVFHTGWPDAPERWCGGINDQDRSYWVFQGGVSLPRASTLKDLNVTARELGALQPAMRRAPAQSKTLSADPKLVQYARTPQYNQRQKISMDLSQDGKVTVLRQAEAVKLDRTTGNWVPEEAGVPVFNRGQKVETAGQSSAEIFDLVSYRKGQSNSSVRVGEVDLGSIKMNMGRSSGRISLESHVLLDAGATAQRLSRADPGRWKEALLADPKISAVYREGDLHFARYGDQWMRFEAQAKSTIHTKEGAIARASVERSFFDIEPPKTINVYRAEPTEILARASSNDGISFALSPRQNGSLAIDIRGPPPPPPPNVTGKLSAAADPGPNNFLLWMNRSPDGTVTARVADKNLRIPTEAEFKMILDKAAKRDVTVDEWLIVDGVRRRDPVKPLAGSDRPLHEPGVLQVIKRERETLVDDIKDAYRAQDFERADQLLRQHRREFGKLSNAERAEIAEVRLQSTRYADEALRAPSRAEIMRLLQTQTVQAVAKKRINDLLAIARTDPARAQRVWQQDRRLFTELAYTDTPLAPVISNGRGGLIANLNCVTQRVNTAEASLSGWARYVTVKSSPDLWQTGLPLDAPGIVYLKLPSEFAEISRTLAAQRVQHIWIGSGRKFRIDPGRVLPTLEEALSDVAKRQELEDHLTVLLRIVTERPPGGAAGALEASASDGSDNEKGVLLAEFEEDESVSCAARFAEFRGEQEN